MRAGDVLGHRFELIRALGEGGMGIVYHAFDRERREAVAVKTLRGFDPDGLLRLKREFRELVELVHPNLVRLHELLGDGGSWWIAMELIDGVAITDYLAERDPREVRAVLAQLVEAVAAVHAAGKLHRDIKPANVLVTGEGRVVLLDFGLVTRLEADELRREAVDGLNGTPVYMAPEHFEGGAITAAADWYAVGAVLFEALAGEPAFGGRFPEVVLAKLRPEVPLASDRRDGVAADLAALAHRLMARDPLARPGVVELRRALAVGSPPSAPEPPHASVESFVGRARELACLAEAWSAVRDRGRAHGVRIRGASGIGKTALVRELLERLGRDEPELLVLAGRCHERETVPFKAFDPIVDALVRYLCSVSGADLSELVPVEVATLALAFPVLGRLEAAHLDPARLSSHASDPHERRRAVAAALRALLARVARRERLVVWLDDLQWSDVDSAKLFEELVRGPDAPPILWIACHREVRDAAAPGLAAFERGFASLGDASRVIDLDALSSADSARLARERAGGVLGRAEAERIAALGGGNPFFVLALADHVVEDGAAHGSRDGAALVPSVEELLGQRLARLPDGARRLLEVVAIAGGPVSEGLAAEVAGIDAPLATVGDLERGRWVARSGEARGPLDTRHDRVREATLAAIPADRRAMLHGGLADRWIAAGDVEPARIANQLRGAHRLGEARDFLETAARRAAATLAFDAAASLFREALGLAGADASTSLGVELAAALANAGRGAEAAEVFLAASARADAAAAPALRWRAAEEWLRAGFVDRGLAVAGDALAALGMPMPASMGSALRGIVGERLRLWLERRSGAAATGRIAAEDLARVDTSSSFAAAMGLVDPMVGAYYQARHLRLAARLRDEPERTSRALALEAAYRAALGTAGPERIAGLFAEARAQAERSGEPRAIAFVRLLEGIAWHQHGEWGRSRALALEAEASFRERCAGVAWERVNARRLLLTNLYWLGDFRELARTVPAIVEDARRRGDHYEELVVTGFFAVLTHLAADDVDAAAHAVERAASIASSDTPRLFDVYRLLGACHVDLHRGRSSEAWDRLAGAWSGLERARALRMTAARILLADLRARVALACAAPGAGRRARLRIAARDARTLRHLPVRWPAALAAVIEAGLAEDRGDAHAARSALESARAAFESRGMAVHTAAVGHRLASLDGPGARAKGRGGAIARLAALGIADPGRWAAAVAPVPSAGDDRPSVK